MTTYLTTKERAELEYLRDAIQQVFDYGKYKKVDGETFWAVPTDVIDEIDRILVEEFGQ